MKRKGFYWVILIFSIFMLIGGISVISENGGDIADYLMFIIFIGIASFSVYKLFKISKKESFNNYNTSEIFDNPKEIEYSQKTNSNQNENSIYDNNYEVEENISSLNENKDYNYEIEKLKKTFNNEKDLLKMKLKLKEDYIQSLETEKKEEVTQDSKDSKQKDKQKEEVLYNSKPLNLTYTKARKLENNFVVLDFETTGLQYRTDEIIQYGIVEYVNGKVTHEYTQYFKPGKPVGKTVMKKTGITNEFLQDKPKLNKFYLLELKNFLEGNTIVAHNAPYDMKFLLNNFHDFNITTEKFRAFDTLTHSRRLITETPNHKLKTLKEYFNLDSGQSHQALNDARATGKLALLLLERQNASIYE